MGVLIKNVFSFGARDHFTVGFLPFSQSESHCPDVHRVLQYSFNLGWIPVVMLSWRLNSHFSQSIADDAIAQIFINIPVENHLDCCGVLVGHQFSCLSLIIVPKRGATSDPRTVAAHSVIFAVYEPPNNRFILLS